ncbi:hypothetical protein ACM92P_002361 [Cronobacter dublinensis]
MKCLKLSLFAVIGAVCGAALMLLILPVVCRLVVGPVYGEDQMSQNFLIFLVGTPLLALLGALAGWFLGKNAIGAH